MVLIPINLTKGRQPPLPLFPTFADIYVQMNSKYIYVQLKKVCTAFEKLPGSDFMGLKLPPKVIVALESNLFIVSLFRDRSPSPIFSRDSFR